MSYKTELQLNNAELEQILESILALPDAGSIGPVVEKDINFWDFDGTLLYSYTLEEMQALTELPPAPKPNRDFLAFDKWLWTLDEIKAADGSVDVGAIYTTMDNAAYIELSLLLPNEEITLNVRDNPTVEWGDGTTSNSVAMGTKHTYEQPGDYTIKIIGGGSLGGGSTATSVISGDIRRSAVNAVFSNKGRGTANYCFYDFISMKHASVPSTGNGQYIFQNCYNLEHFNAPSVFGLCMLMDCKSLRLVCSTPNLGGSALQSQSLRGCSSLARTPVYPARATSEGYMLYGCASLEKIIIKPSGTALGSYTGYACYAAKSIIVEEGTASLGAMCFYNCFSARIIDLPSTLTSIAAQAFQNCAAVKKMVFKSATPPAVANSNAFTGIPASCIVEVPAASLAAYQSATNYGTIAAQMVGV